MNPAQQPQNIDRELNLISEIVTKNSAGVIILPAKPTPDAVAAATSMYLALTKMGKTVGLVCSAIPESDMSGADKIKNTLTVGGDNLVISFPYKEGAVDKVDYNFDVENEKFNLIIVPREGFPKLDPKDVNYSFAGGKIEFIVTIDSPNLNTLGDIYTKNQNVFNGKNIINIDRHLINNNYGTINVVVKTASSTSELVYKVLAAMKVNFDREMATNLYSGIVAATNNFSSYSVNADTFEAVATLLRAGAVKKPYRPPARPGMTNAMPGMNPFAQMGGMNPFAAPQMQQPNRQPNQVKPMPQPTVRSEKQTRAIENVEEETTGQEGQMDASTEGEDWLKPKIFNENDGLV
jgi:hypothetical protein